MTLSPQDLAFFANKLEARFHGTPSGLDTAVVAYENCICFRKNPPLLTAIPLAHAPGTKPWKFALIDSGIRASTLAMIRLAAPYFAGTRGEKRVQQFDKLADQVMASIEHHDIFSLADAMNSAAQLLKKSGIVTEQLSSLIDQIRSIGVLAAKTTGAGGGGFVLALMHPDQEERQMKAMEQKFGAGNVHFVELGCSNGNY
jgi:mevalonate kinase